ncbi:GNAT family N-acetyltransferase [Rosenbergiella collisarenosi]|uniref:GNAT family N-acetyltransferase n=1 Tax=Rosenbergiella collisarenosi TaxID=1544695 RepID=UPI001F4EBB8C|nr:GNAT family N-acetyltransferase [Rosenbergiella collisarenosi]
MDNMLKFMLSQYEGLPVSQSTLHRWLKHWIYNQEARQIDNSFSAKFPWKEMSLPQSYFLQRKLCIDGQFFLTGPRFRGGDINHPFVDIVASSAAVNDFVLQTISKEWVELKPKHIRQLTPGKRTDMGVVDQLVYAAPLNHDPKYCDDALTLAPAVRQDFDWCRQAVIEVYKHSWSTTPALVGSLFPIDEADLLDHIIKGNAYLINLMSNRVGLIVCEERELSFLNGIFILEEIILPAFRGSSLASRAQRLLQNHLYQLFGKDCLIAGTIIPENYPSIRTAEKAGRACVLKYEFLTSYGF